MPPVTADPDPMLEIGNERKSFAIRLAASSWSSGSAETDSPFMSRDVISRAGPRAGQYLIQAGLFFAVPLSGGDGVNLFARIGPRF